MDAQARLAEIVATVQAARAMPMSASAIVNRVELLEKLGELGSLLPVEFDRARAVLRERDEVVAAGRAEAEEIVAAARAEARRLVSRTEVAREARAEAERLLEAARGEVLQIRAEVDDYVDAKLANFEVVLHKTLRAVARGRAKLRGEDDAAELVEAEELRALPG